MAFARRVFIGAGIYGMLVVAPMYFLEARIGADLPPAITHPEFYYGFVGVTLAWQIVYLTIGTDPVRYRPIMPIGIFAKTGYFVALAWLYASDRVAAIVAGGAVIDLLLAALFAVAYVKAARTPYASVRAGGGAPAPVQ